MVWDKEKTFHAVILFLLFGCGALAVYILKPSYLVNILLVYSLPTLVNFLWLEKTRGKILLFALITTLLFAVPVEIISRLADAWNVQSTLPRFLGIAPLENLLYAFFNFLWPLSFYEYFINEEKHRRISPKWQHLVSLYLIFSFLTFVFFAIDRNLIAFDYWEVGMFIVVLPMSLIYLGNKKLLKKTIAPTIFFALIFLIHEILSMSLGHWWWPGEYLWPIKILGQTFPLDDVLVWYLLSTPALIGGYEFFFDDYR